MSEATDVIDSLTNCGPIGSPGPACSICPRCIAEQRGALIALLRERIEKLEAALEPFAKAGELFVPTNYHLSIYRPVAGEQYWLGSDDLVRAYEARGNKSPENVEAPEPNIIAMAGGEGDGNV